MRTFVYYTGAAAWLYNAIVNLSHPDSAEDGIKGAVHCAIVMAFVWLANRKEDEHQDAEEPETQAEGSEGEPR